MISTFLCPHTRDLYITGRTDYFGDSSFTAMRLLDMLQCITSPQDIPLSAHCDRGGPLPSGYTMPVDDKYTLFFSWRGGLACHVQISSSAGLILEGSFQQQEAPRRVVSHPGRVLQEFFMIPYRISANRLAGSIKVPVSRILDVINERRGISADTATRLSLCVGGSPRFWTAMQSEYELSVIRAEKDMDPVVRLVRKAD